MSRQLVAHLSTNVEQLRSVERLLVVLLDDEDFVVNVLFPQIVMQISEKLGQLALPIAIRNYDSRREAWIAFLGPILA